VVLEGAITGHAQVRGTSDCVWRDLRVQLAVSNNILDEMEALLFFRECGNHPSVWASSGHGFVR
jgi:hypothetical protein